MRKQKTIIIGAGPSGIVAGKYARENGLDFVILEKTSEIGGVWNPDTGLVWKNLHTNNSRQNCKFTDFDYPFEPHIFPTSQQFYKYLHAFVEHFRIKDHIIFNCEVTKLQKDQETGEYTLIFKQNDQFKEERAMNVIIASGLFSDPYIPKDIPGLQNFEGSVCHSRNYKCSESFQKRRVLVIGGSFTAIEIASDLSNSCISLYHCYRLPFFILPRFFKTSNHTLTPIDLRNHKRNPDVLTPKLIPSESFIIQRQLKLLKLCEEQQNYPELRIEKEDLKLPLPYTISTGYLEGVKKGKIISYKTTVKQIRKDSVVLQNGQEILVDTIMFCTGCQSSLKYLSEEIQEIIQAKPWVQKHPTIMFKSIMHPKLKNLYFMGIYRGIMVPICEMQAKFVIQMITNQGRFPSQQQIAQDLQIQQSYRNMKRIPQNRFVHPNYCDTLTPYLNQSMDLYTLKEKQPEKFQKFIQFPVIQHRLAFTTQDIDWQIQKAERALEASSIKLNPI